MGLQAVSLKNDPAQLKSGALLSFFNDFPQPSSTKALTVVFSRLATCRAVSKRGSDISMVVFIWVYV